MVLPKENLDKLFLEVYLGMIKGTLYSTSLEQWVSTQLTFLNSPLEMGLTYASKQAYTKLVIEGESQLIIQNIKHLFHGSKTRKLLIN